MSQVLSVRENGRKRVVTMNEEPSKTVQSDRHLAEMKSILAKYEGVGIVDHLRDVDLQFRDVSEFEDFADLMRQTAVAREEFMRLPSKVREIFHHDVNEWLDAAHDEDRLEAIRPKLEELGLIAKAEAPQPQRVEVVHRNADGTFASKPPESAPSGSGADPGG